MTVSTTYTVPEAAARLNVTAQAIYAAIKRGELSREDGITGDDVRISEDILRAWAATPSRAQITSRRVRVATCRWCLEEWIADDNPTCPHCT